MVRRRKAPNRKPVSSLFNASATTATSYVWKFLKIHGSSTCKFCVLAFGHEKCPVMLFIKRHIDAMNADTANFVYSKMYNLWNSSWSIKDTKWKTNQRYVISWLFYRLDVRIKHFCCCDTSRFDFLRRFGKAFETVCFSDKIIQKYHNVDIQWKSILSAACNIVFLSLSGVQICGELLQTIGLKCPNLKVITDVYLNCCVDKDELFMMFIDTSGDQPVENPCCNNLKVFEVSAMTANDAALIRKSKRSIQTFRYSRLRDLFNALFTCAHNLISIGRGFLVEKYLNEQDTGTLPKTKLQEVRSAELEPANFELLKTFCPELRKLELNSLKHNLLVFPELHTLPSLESITLNTTDVDPKDSCLYKGILNSTFDNLKELFIHCPVTRIKLDVFATQLPALVSLSSLQCLGLNWDAVTFFQNLQNVTIYFEPEAAIFGTHWFEAFSRTIVELRMHFADQTNLKQLTSTLSTLSFPHLETVRIQTLKCDAVFLKDIIKNCPKLHKVEGLTPDSDAQADQIMRYLYRNNINCQVLPA